MALLSKNFKLWLHGLVAAAITAFSTAATGALTLPSDFNFTHEGMIKTLKLVAVPTAISVFAYLKKSPVPALSDSDSPENGQA